VATDWTEGERQKRFLEAGKKLKADLESRLKSGEAFEKAAVAAGTAAGLTVEAKMIAPFTLRNRPQDLDYAALGALENLEKGMVSDMVFAGDKGLLVYAADKKLPDLNESSPQFAEMSSQLASRMASSAASAYISDLVTKELSRSEPKPE
jgi:peptidyl-prolyl cis-trans isomerase D